MQKRKAGASPKERAEIRRASILNYAKGLSRNPSSEMQREPAVITLPAINFISHEEIERKYGRLR